MMEGTEMGTVAVIGGGAAGMMAAVAAASEGARVILLEQKDRIGKKILSTGNGRCNFHEHPIRNRCVITRKIPCFRGGSLKNLMLRKQSPFFSKWVFIRKTGTDTSTLIPIRHPQCWIAFRMELDRLRVDIRTDIHIREIDSGKKGFVIRTEKENVRADRVILCTGSKAAPSTGSDGSGYDLAKTVGATD